MEQSDAVSELASCWILEAQPDHELMILYMQYLSGLLFPVLAEKEQDKELQASAQSMD